MISCPNCHHKELPGALFCGNCGIQLPQVSVDAGTSNFGVDTIQEIEEATIIPFPDLPEGSPYGNVAVHILSNGDIIHLEKKFELTFGRSTKGQTILPDIDLNPYDAYESGVSRLHANIKCNQHQTTIKDLGSANGTRLNGKKINPHEKHTLHHGDILTLGKLKIQILIRE